MQTDIITSLNDDEPVTMVIVSDSHYQFVERCACLMRQQYENMVSMVVDERITTVYDGQGKEIARYECG